MARPHLTRSRTFGFGLAIATLAFAACGHSNNSTPKPVVTATAVVTAGPSASPCVISLGIAFNPDGGNGNGFHGVQVTHYEGNDQNLCGGVAPAATPMAVVFPSSVSQLAFGSEGVDTVAIEQNGTGGYSLVQDVFGGQVGQLVPAGSSYDVNLPPPTPSATSTATPIVAPLIPNVTGVSMISDSTNGVAIVVGPAASPPAMVALTNLTNAPPDYGLNVPFSGTTYTLKTIPDLPRSIVRLSGTTTTAGTTALVRGPGDLLSFAVTVAASGYLFNAEADDTNLGSGTVLSGKGNIALDPADGSRALVGGTTAGGTTVLTLVTGLPLKIVETATLTLPAGSNIHSIDIAANGDVAVIATDVGIYSVTGVDSSLLTLVTPFHASPLNSKASSINYTNCNGVASQLTTFYSVGLSEGSEPSNSLYDYLVALGTVPGLSCPSGNNASLVAIPFNPSTGLLAPPTATPTASPTPAASSTPVVPAPTPPAVFVQNNMIPPPAGADVLVVH